MQQRVISPQPDFYCRVHVRITADSLGLRRSGQTRPWQQGQPRSYSSTTNSTTSLNSVATTIMYTTHRPPHVPERGTDTSRDNLPKRKGKETAQTYHRIIRSRRPACIDATNLQSFTLHHITARPMAPNVLMITPPKTGFHSAPKTKTKGLLGACPSLANLPSLCGIVANNQANQR